MKLPVIKAFLALDEKGKPKGRSSGNYHIVLRLADAPADAHRVTYQLDDSYYDPVREVRDRDAQFSEEIESYGDYEIKATIRLKDHAILTSRALSEALREAHGDNPDPDVRKALEEIASN